MTEEEMPAPLEEHFVCFTRATMIVKHQIGFLEMIEWLWYQFGRFFWWIQQGGNANLVLVGITAVYVILTHRLLRWNTIQAREQIQPKLNLHLSFTDEDQKRGQFRIENVGDYSVVVLEVGLSCYVPERPLVVDRAGIFEYALISPRNEIGSGFDFRNELADTPKEACAYCLTVVASDTSGRVPMTYEYLPLFHRTTCKSGKPLRVRLRLWWRPIRIGYYRSVHALFRRR